MKKNESQNPPRGKLSKEARRWWRHFTEGWTLDEAALLILLVSLESFDRMREAQGILARDGIVIRDRFGQEKSHPCNIVERDSRLSMLRALKALALDIEPLQDGPGRPGGS